MESNQHEMTILISSLLESPTYSVKLKKLFFNEIVGSEKLFLF